MACFVLINSLEEVTLHFSFRADCYHTRDGEKSYKLYIYKYIYTYIYPGVRITGAQVRQKTWREVLSSIHILGDREDTFTCSGMIFLHLWYDSNHDDKRVHWLLGVQRITVVPYRKGSVVRHTSDLRINC